MAPTTEESEPVRMIEVGEIGRRTSSFRNGSMTTTEDDDHDGDVGDASLWKLIDRLPTFERLRWSLLLDDDNSRRKVVDVTKLGDEERHLFIQKLINNVENDNLKLLRKVNERLHK